MLNALLRASIGINEKTSRSEILLPDCGLEARVEIVDSLGGHPALRPPNETANRHATVLTAARSRRLREA
jgi:hypothetical protein